MYSLVEWDEPTVGVFETSCNGNRYTIAADNGIGLELRENGTVVLRLTEIEKNSAYFPPLLSHTEQLQTTASWMIQNWSDICVICLRFALIQPYRESSHFPKICHACKR